MEEKKEEYWFSKTYLGGFVNQVNGKACLNYADEWKRQTRINFEIKNKANIMELLDDGIWYWKQSKFNGNIPNPTILQLLKEYRTKYTSQKTDEKKRVDLAIKYFINQTFHIKQIIELQEHIKSNINLARMLPNQQRKLLLSLKDFLQYAVEEGYIRTNPILDSMIPAHTKKTIHKFSPEEVDKLLRYFYIKDIEVYHLICFYSYCPLTLSEILKLQWKYVTDTEIKVDNNFSINLSEKSNLAEVVKHLQYGNVENNKKLFHWNANDPVHKIIKAACIQLGFYRLEMNFNSFEI